MSDEQVWYDLTYRFSSGQIVSIDVLEGRDVIQDIAPCPHCGAPAKVKVTSLHPEERTATIHTDKLDAVDCTKRIVKPDLQHGHSLLELS